MATLEITKQELKKQIGDDKLLDNLFFSFGRISEEYIGQKPVDLLQNTGLFVESALRVAEHLTTGQHTPLSNKLDIDKCAQRLENLSGAEGLRIHLARLSRAIYDFRTRKKSVHLKAVDPQAVDAALVFNISNWIMIEIFKESGIPSAENAIQLFFTRKVPLVQEVEGILRTTNPRLLGTHRILLLLYSMPPGLSEDELFEGARRKIRTRDHLAKNLRNMDSKDLIHKLKDGRWVLFGNGFNETEKLIAKFA